jgi:hypothetical protein
MASHDFMRVAWVTGPVIQVVADDGQGEAEEHPAGVPNRTVQVGVTQQP